MLCIAYTVSEEFNLLVFNAYLKVKTLFQFKVNLCKSELCFKEFVFLQFCNIWRNENWFQ